ncbi:MAG: hypothetical protein ISS70_15590 [Phycisphaerae bacterium]|nr:hypothetical protein [Phycisphaerae bacterium]
MSESITAENKEQNRKKPPLSRCRIAGEILAGLAVAVLVLFVAFYVFRILAIPGELGEHGIGTVVMLLMFAFFAFPILYGPASAIGVYLVGSRGKQTGSFLSTLGWGFLAGLLPIVMLGVSLLNLTRGLPASVGSVLVAALALGLLIPPIGATYGFNLTRRYRSKPKEDVETDSSDQEE